MLRLKFSLPRPVDVVVYDSLGMEILSPLLAEAKLTAGVLDVRLNELNIPSALIALVNAAKLAINRSSMSTLFDLYVDAFLRISRCHTAITFSDNDQRFWRLRNRHPYLRTIAIQNGRRGFKGDIFSSKSMVPLSGSEINTYFAFAQPSGEIMGALCNSEEVRILGSLRNNSVKIAKAINTEKRIAWVSQYDLGGDSEDLQREEIAFRLFLQVVESLEFSGEIVVLLRSQSLWNTEEERRVFSRIAENIMIRFSEKQNYATNYEAIDSSSWVVGRNSTMILEAIARGIPAFCIDTFDPCSDSPVDRFGWPSELGVKSEYHISTLDGSEIQSALSDFFSQASGALSFREDLMIYDEGNSSLVNYLLDLKRAKNR